MARYDALYIGRGSREIDLASRDAARPARFTRQLPAHTRTQRPRSLRSGGSCQAGQPAQPPAHDPQVHPPGRYQKLPHCHGLTRLPRAASDTMLATRTRAGRGVHVISTWARRMWSSTLWAGPDETRHLIVRDGQAVLAQLVHLLRLRHVRRTASSGDGRQNQDVQRMAAGDGDARVRQATVGNSDCGLRMRIGPRSSSSDSRLPGSAPPTGCRSTPTAFRRSPRSRLVSAWYGASVG